MKITMIIAALALIVFAGCAKEEPAAEPAAPEITQQTCPVMGNPINPSLSVEFEGKKVYFCCNGCPEAFLADPEKYRDKIK